MTTTPAELNPIVAHDGSRVAYTVTEHAQSTAWVVATSGGTPHRLCDGCAAMAWLADSRHVLVVSRPGGTMVRAVSLDDGKAAPVLPPEVGSGRLYPSWDGRWLAFMLQGQGSLWIAPLRPGAPAARAEWRPIDVFGPGPRDKSAIGGERPVGWSPDGRLLYLLLEPDGSRCLHAVRIDPARGVASGEPFPVHHFHDPQRRLSSTPFGSGIVKDAFIYDQFETTASIWLLDPTPAATSARLE